LKNRRKEEQNTCSLKEKKNKAEKNNKQKPKKLEKMKNFFLKEKM
jgi:hypothetical protein